MPLLFSLKWKDVNKRKNTIKRVISRGIFLRVLYPVETILSTRYYFWIFFAYLFCHLFFLLKRKNIIKKKNTIKEAIRRGSTLRVLCPVETILSTRSRFVFLLLIFYATYFSYLKGKI